MSGDRAFSAVGDRLITEADFFELTRLCLKAFVMRNQVEAMAARVCEILGIDPSEDSVCKDFAEEIIYHGTMPADAIKNIQNRIQ